jgi:hypothetical protein
MSTAFPLAFSLAAEIKTLGAYAGFAAVIGLAVLSLLYFAQARELRRLSEWAGRAPERTAPPPARTPTGAPGPSAAPAAAAAPPGPPGGTGAPLTAAPPTIAAAPSPVAVPVPMPPLPAGGPSTIAARAGAAPAAPPAGVAAPDPAARPPAAFPAAAGGGSPAAAAAAPAPRPAGPPPGVPRPSAAGGPPAAGSTLAARTAAGAGPGLADPPRAQAVTRPPAPSRAPAGPPAERRPPGGTPRPSPAAAAAAAPAPASTPARRRPADPGQGVARRQRLVRAGGAIAVLLVAVLAATQLFGGGSGAKKPTAGVPGTGAPASGAAAAPAPSSVTVTVLNGSGVPGLARRISLTLTNGGYRKANVTVGNAPDTQNSTTIVAYAPGQEAAARAVAAKIGADPAAVAPLDQTAPGAPSTQVAVTVGADLRQ